MKKIVASLLITLFCLSLAACEKQPFRRAEVVLGDAVALSVAAKGSKAKTAVNEMFALANDVFGEMNLSEKDSLLTRFNADDSVRPCEITEHIFNTLILAKTAWEKSNGAFDVTSLPLSRLWRVDTAGLHSLRPDINDLNGSAADAEKLPTKEQVKETLQYVGMDKLEFYEESGKYYLKKTDGRVQIDLGGIAKGYFVDLCKGIAEKYSLESCLIDLSGNLYLYGGGLKSGGDWTVGIKNPRPRLTYSEALRDYVAAVSTAGNRSYVTGGDYQRFYYARYKDVVSEAQLLAVCHIINPKSGLPVGIKYDEETNRYETDYDAVCMAVVSAQNSALCDAYTTAVAVLGLQEGAKLLKDNGFDGLIFTNPDLKYDEESYPPSEDGPTPTKKGRGKMKTVGSWHFMDGYDNYKTDYEAV